MSNSLSQLLESGVVAIMRAQSPEPLIAAADALLAGGVSAIEVTMTTPGALDVIRAATDRYGSDVLFGVGSVLDAATARAAILAGASFVVCPVLDLDTISMCRRYSVPIIPGAFTPTEIITAWQAGADIVKVFPASLGGPSLIKAILAPLPQVRLMPVGGVNLDTAEAFVRAGAVGLGVGSSLVNQRLLNEERFAEITARARKFRAALATSA